MTFLEMITSKEITIVDAALKTGKTQQTILKYIKTKAKPVSKIRTLIAKKYNFYFEKIAWEQIKGKSKWESLIIECKRLQKEEDDKL